MNNVLNNNSMLDKINMAKSENFQINPLNSLDIIGNTSNVLNSNVEKPSPPLP
jgi:hypothetical protein